jgi:cystathionine beta-lyase
VGRVWKRQELEAMAERALRAGALLVSDEIHADIVFRGHAHLPLASLSPEVAARTVTLLAPSKTFNIAGLQTSLAIIPDPNLRRTFRNELESLHLEGGNLFGMLALETAYGKGEPWLEALLAYLEDNLDFLGNFLRDRLPSIGYTRPEGTYVAWLDFRSLGLSPEELQHFLVHEARLALNAGTSFGPGGEGFARLNFACPRSLLSEGLRRLADAVSRLEERRCCATEA